MRPDLAIVAGLVGENSRVLDLGCGDGELLETLIRDRGCSGLGVEKDTEKFHACISRGVPVTNGDLEEELVTTDEGSFDCSVLSLTLQAVRHPDRVLEEMRRVASRQVVSLPNFAYWRLRTSLLLRGRMPVTGTLPYQWYDTPNIHLCTLADFEALIADTGPTIEKRVLLDDTGRPAARQARLAPNLLAVGAAYLLTS